jgi:hypothetical protein
MNSQLAISSPTRTGRNGVVVFNAIVTLVRNRTGLNYPTAFNKVLADNRDLLSGSLDATNHTQPLLRLLNRAEMATGTHWGACTEFIVDKVAKLTNRFFPSLSNTPTALQWDILSRTASALEKCGIAHRLFNRTSAGEISDADWKTANDRAGAVLTFLEDREEKSDDIGASEKFQGMVPQSKWRTFKGQIERLMKDEGLSISEAFAKLKETQPIFWTYAMLSFEPEKQ